jgi:hypothetical protein
MNGTDRHLIGLSVSGVLMDGQTLIVLVGNSRAVARSACDGKPCDWPVVFDGTSRHWPGAHIT